MSTSLRPKRARICRAARRTVAVDATIFGPGPPGSLIETDRRSEFLALKSFHGRGVAAPEPLILELEGAELERPFFIMARVDGGTAGSPFQPNAYEPHAARLGADFFSADFFFLVPVMERKI